MSRSMSITDMRDSIIKNLKPGTGKSLEEWVALVKAGAPQDAKAAVRWLKAEHELGSIKARVVVGEAMGQPFGQDYDDPADLLEKMYSGKKTALKPVYEAADVMIKEHCPDIAQKMCKTYASYARRVQFAVIQPTTQTAVDIGLALPKDTQPTGRLEAAQNVGGARINFRIRVKDVGEVDSHLKKWLQLAYQSGA